MIFLEDSQKIDILSLDLPQLELKMAEIGEKKFRAKQIFQWLHVKKVFSFDEMTDISVQLRGRLKEFFCIKSLFVAKRLESCIDNTVKYLYRLPDGNYVETVLMEYHYGRSICVSTQVGCKMGCSFCASAIAGFVRNPVVPFIIGVLILIGTFVGIKYITRTDKANAQSE